MFILFEIQLVKVVSHEEYDTHIRYIFAREGDVTFATFCFHAT